jgi:V-type H+-transporting ATPase subunit d
MRTGFLTNAEYRQLAQCTTFEDVKLCFSDTDYCNVLSNVNTLTKDVIMERCQAKFVEEFNYIKQQAVGAYSTFIDFVSYEYLIDNISFLISGLIKRQQGSSSSEYDPEEGEELISKCDPLGYDPHLKSIMGVFENSGEGRGGGDGLVELYRTVLVEMPVARYFEMYFASQAMQQPDKNSGQESFGKSEIAKIYTEGEFEVITNMLKKLWLEDFYQVCKKMGGETAVVMGRVLGFEADYRAIEITMNSFGTQLNESNERDAERKALFCNIGTLYPRVTERKWQDINDTQKLSDNLEHFQPFNGLWRSATEEAKETDEQIGVMSDLLKKEEVKVMREGFDGQGHFGVFYSWTKLKQAELRNLRYILSCIEMKQTDPKYLSRYLAIFK